MLALLAFALLVGNVPSLDAADKHPAKMYDGSWWLAIGSDDRSGFLDGAGDCLTSATRAKWLTIDVEQLPQKVTQYYKDHPAERTASIKDVWEKLVLTSRPRKPAPGGEVWNNPHGYYNGLWWRQGSDDNRLGFAEGYLWCLRTQVNPPTETYSHPVSYYVEKIDAYLQAHPKGDDEAVAIILSRFRDKPAPKAKEPEGKQ